MYVTANPNLEFNLQVSQCEVTYMFDPQSTVTLGG